MTTGRLNFNWGEDSSTRRTPLLWTVFGVCWAVDTLTTILFFSVPYAFERSPVTVRLYQLLGSPGVILAACMYAVIVIVIVRLLPRPFAEAALGVMTSLYVAFALHNTTLLVWNVSLIVFYSLICLGGFLLLVFSRVIGEPDPVEADRRS